MFRVDIFNRICAGMLVVAIVSALAGFAEVIVAVIALSPLVLVLLALYAWRAKAGILSSLGGEPLSVLDDARYLSSRDLLKGAGVLFGILALLIIASFVVDASDQKNQAWLMVLGFAIIMVPAGLIVLRGMPGLLSKQISWIRPRLIMGVNSRVGRRRKLCRGTYALMQGRYGEAAEFIEGYAAEHPEDQRGYVSRAWLNASNDDFVRAIEDTELALAIERTADGLYSRGAIRFMAGDVEGSREDLEESLSLSPRNPLAALFHCYVLIELRLLDKAIDQLTQLWRTFTLETIYIAAGDAYRLRGDVVEAAKWWDATLALAQSCPNPVHNHSDAVAYCLVRQGHTDEAQRAVEAALVQDPKNQLAAYTKALISNQRDDLDSLEQILEGLSPFRVMTALMDPDFTPLLTEPRFREILANALEERQRTVAEIRRRINGSAA